LIKVLGYSEHKSITFFLVFSFSSQEYDFSNNLVPPTTHRQVEEYFDLVLTCLFVQYPKSFQRKSHPERDFLVLHLSHQFRFSSDYFVQFALFFLPILFALLG
jgi:hypothetical protein